MAIVPLTRVPSDWLLTIVRDLRQLAIEIPGGTFEQQREWPQRLNRIASALEPTALMYVEKERLEKAP